MSKATAAAPPNPVAIFDALNAYIVSRALQGAIKGRETVKVKGKQAYFEYPDGVGNSRLTITVIEKHLATSGTARNWNTVLKLASSSQA